LSQVVVTDDKLKDKRDQSREQERRIDVRSVTKKWLRSDISGRDPIATAVGIAVLPIVAIWSFLGAFITVMLLAVRFLMVGIGKVVGGTKSIVIPEKPPL